MKRLTNTKSQKTICFTRGFGLFPVGKGSTWIKDGLFPVGKSSTWIEDELFPVGKGSKWIEVALIPTGKGAFPPAQKPCLRDAVQTQLTHHRHSRKPSALIERVPDPPGSCPGSLS